MALISTADVIINASSGACDSEAIKMRLSELFKSCGVESRILLARRGADVIELARQVRHSDSQIVVAGGGDGTINAVASILSGTDKTLGILPLGTFNYFAKNLGIPLDLEGAVQTIAENYAVNVDVGEVNGHLFINNSSLGLYPSIIRVREKEYRRWGRSQWAAYLAVVLTILRVSPFMNVRLNADGQELACRTPLVFVGSNEYQIASFDLPGRRCFDKGEMALYITHPMGRMGLLRLALQALARRLRTAPDLQVLCTREVWIETRRKRLRVALDGEVVVMSTPLHYLVRSGALRVLVPKVNARIGS